jgi:hypothetical protein
MIARTFVARARRAPRALRVAALTTFLAAYILPRDAAVRRPAPSVDAPERWTRAFNGTIGLWIDSTGATPGWRPEFVRLAEQAAAMWNEAGAPIRFVRVASSSEAQVLVHWRRWQPGALRGETTRQLNARGEILGADVTIVLAPGLARPVSPPTELRAIALHELGHVLGLSHDRSRSAIMSPRVGPSVLTDRDREALREVLGTKAGG